MTPPAAPYVCAVCRAPVGAGARFCASCGTPFSERPPLRVEAATVPLSTPGATVPPRVPVAAPPPAYGPPPGLPVPVEDEAPARGNAAVWVAVVAVLFVAALVAAYLLFAERPAPGEGTPDMEDMGTVDEAPVPSVPPVDEGLDDGSFPDDASFDDLLPPDLLDEGLPGGDVPETEPPPAGPPQETPVDGPNTPDTSDLAAAWGAYQGVRASYDEAVRRAGTGDKARAEIAGACARLIEAGDAVLRLPGRERYASEIARDRRDC